MPTGVIVDGAHYNSKSRAREDVEKKDAGFFTAACKRLGWLELL
jgi:hypothetical protein